MHENPAYPLQRNDAGVWHTTDFETSVEHGIIQTIRTGLGQRPMLKHIGCRLNEILFMNADESRDALATVYVQDACVVMEPYAIIHEVTLENEADDDSDEIYIHISYGIVDSAKTGKITIGVSL